MANLGFNINASDLPQEESKFDPLPPGDYNVTIAGAEIAPTKSGTGQYIKLKMTVTGPTHQGRVVFSNLNIKNDSQKAEEIGRQQLGSIMRAIGLPAIQDTDQLIGGSLVVKLKIVKSEGYDDKNEVSAYKSATGSAPAMPSAMPAQAAPAQQSGAKAPWMK